MEPLSLSVVARDLRTALSVHGLNQVLTLEVGGADHLVLARQIQRHPVRHTVSHVDFQVVRRDEIVSAEVPVVLVGAPLKVERERGVVEHVLTSLTVHSTPEQIPQELKIDVSELEVGGSVRVRDLELPKGVTTDIDPDEIIVIAAASTVEAQVAAAEEGGPEVAASEPEVAGSPVGEGD
jgi:large subunit ribosomal protein L25